MNLKNLNAFIALVQCKSFTAAADALCVTQPTISKQLRQLEDALEVKLFIRQGHHLELTPAGQVLYEKGEEILYKTKQLKLELNEFKNHITGKIKLGLPPTVGSFFFGPLLAKFGVMYPGIQIQLIEDGAEALTKQVLDGHVDVAVAMLPTHSMLNFHEFICDDLYFISLKPSSWQAREVVKLEDITEEEFVLFNENFMLSTQLASAFSLRKRPLKVNARSSNWQFLVALVQAGRGCTVLPDTIAKQLDDSIFHKAFLDEDGQKWHLGLIWSQQSFISNALMAWLEYCKIHLPTLSK
ncbi:LysR family transcriptional regulator [Hydromonas duriensis]|uniref:DNA-binding transcriptional LysR family regulator n=1 Tax=Hydromonas duriensis TaxID=1527608 RepID=A0A4R6YAW7_9BURK|nr:LysR family transcriptional regulator [Hydromonas duriensis]TDR32706.1 DNA-binding transcriptional LysR family regulator [Hydromonas duriensis]